MPKITKLDGTLTDEFVGFDFDEEDIYLGYLGEWRTHTIYMPVDAYATPDFLSGLIEDMGSVVGCGVRPIMTRGSVEIEME